MKNGFASLASDFFSTIVFVGPRLNAGNQDKKPK